MLRMGSALFHTDTAVYRGSMKTFLNVVAMTVLAAPALAADPFTVAKVPVDAQASSAIEAQSLAIQDGYAVAAQILLERLTLAEERQAKGLPELTPEIVGPLIRGQTIENERRSTTRYLGDVSIAFNPSAVQQLLRAQGLTMVTSQAQDHLIVPVGITPDSPTGRSILSGRHAHMLTPLISVRAQDFQSDASFGFPDDSALKSLAQRYNKDRILLVSSTGGGLAYESINVGTGERSRYPVARDFDSLALDLQNDWKEQTAVPSATSLTSTASILYNSLSEWQRLQRAINTASQVSDARLDAVSKDGALMTLRYGDFARLQAEMRQKGVIVERDPQLGLIIRG
jgi:hypothetical protein